MSDTLTDDELTFVVGGAQLNTDSYKFQWKARMVGEEPVIYPDSKTTKARTDYGQCLDNGFARCTSSGGGNDAVGQCKLNAVATCDQTVPMQQ